MKHKTTIIKILPQDGVITTSDIERWRKIFEDKDTVAEQQAIETGKIEVYQLPKAEDDKQYITLVKIGNEDHKPSCADLEVWRDVFKEAEKDPDFKIFVHPGIDISVIEIGKIIAVE